MASKPHRSPPSSAAAAPAAKRPRPTAPAAASSSSGAVQLNPADCNLDFDIEKNGLEGHALHTQGFAYCWSGSRATVGITGGKYCFGCKIISEQKVDMSDTPPDQQHVCRIGISRGDDPVGNLGETMNSFGFGGTGKFSSVGKFKDYGVKFGVGDTIVCAVDLDNKPYASIGFSKNGTWLGTASQFGAGPTGLGISGAPLASRPWESALFPHVLLKNVVVQLQFSIGDGLILKEGYRPWDSALKDGNAITGPSFPSPKECEVLMMVGLPASGKSTWAEKWVKEHPEKRYVLLGTNLALDQMKVPGLLRKQNYGERFDRLMDRATVIFNTLLGRAAKTPRNYILDQTNVYRNARNRKLKPFVNYRKVAVVLFPTSDELKSRAAKRFKEMGKEEPADAVNEMLANFVLPMTKSMPGSVELFDEVIFEELNRAEAQRQLDEMKREPGTSNTNAKRDFSPYSSNSSFKSFSSPSVQKNGAPAGAVASGHWEMQVKSRQRDTLVEISDKIFGSFRWVNHAYPGPGSFGEPRGVGSTMPNYSSYGYLEYGRSSLDPSGGYGVPGSSVTYGLDSCRKPSIESPSSRGADYVHGSGDYPVDHLTARDPSYYWRSPSQNPGHTPHGLASYNSPGAAAYIRDSRVSEACREWQGSHQSAYRELPSYKSPGAAAYMHGPEAPHAVREWQNPYQNENRELVYNNSPAAPYMPHTGVPQAGTDWRSPHQNAYGSAFGTPPPRHSSGIRAVDNTLPAFNTPPMFNHPHGSSYYR